MSGPFVYVATWTIKQGKAEETRKFLSEHVEMIETNEPRLISFDFYLDEDAERASVVQVHPDAESMEVHLEVISEHLAGAFEYLDRTERVQYYGPKSERLAEILAPWEEGVEIVSFPEHLAGFTRTTAR